MIRMKLAVLFFWLFIKTMPRCKEKDAILAGVVKAGREVLTKEIKQ